MSRIAILDDDPVVLETVHDLLVRAGHVSSPFSSGHHLIRVMRDRDFDAFILDWNLLDCSGLHVLEWIRGKIGMAPPVLFLTNRSIEQDIVVGLNAGADDYITKPFSPSILLARLEAQIRRSTGTPPEPVERFGAFEFDSIEQMIRVSDFPIPVTPMEFRLALLLFRNLHRAVARDHIYEALWGRNPSLPTRTIDSHVSKIRRKLNLRPANGYHLMPVYGYGYRLEEIAVKP